MQKINKPKRYLLLSLGIAIMLLNSKVEGAAAWLQVGQKMSNEFFSPVVDIEIEKSTSGTNYTIQNRSNTTVYVRAEVIGTMKEDGAILSSVNAGNASAAQEIYNAMNLGTDWVLGADGYFYYVHPLKRMLRRSLL